MCVACLSSFGTASHSGRDFLSLHHGYFENNGYTSIRFYIRSLCGQIHGNCSNVLEERRILNLSKPTFIDSFVAVSRDSRVGKHSLNARDFPHCLDFSHPKTRL